VTDPTEPTEPTDPSEPDGSAPDAAPTEPAGAAAGDSTEPAEGTGRVAVALRRLRPPEHGASFWAELDNRLADEPQLRLAPRAAIRPITQPPPVIDDRNLASSLAGVETRSGPSRRSGLRWAVWIGAAVVTLLVVAAVLGPDDNSAQTAGGSGTTSAASSAANRANKTTRSTAPETTPATTLPPGTIDPNAPLEPGGVGPLRIGMTLGQLQAAGFPVQADQTTFSGSGGTCYDGRLPGALELRLRFRNPDGQRRAQEPADGVLAAISVDSDLPSFRPSNSGVSLGLAQEQVIAMYPGALDERSHPFVPGGRIFRVDSGDGTGLAYLTDGHVVIGMAGGYMDVIKFVHDCR
jgi:hypothetical protein